MLRAFLPFAIIASMLSGCTGEEPAEPGRTSAVYVRQEPKPVDGGTETLLVPRNPDTIAPAPAYKITDKTGPDGTRVRSVNPVEPGKR